MSSLKPWGQVGQVADSEVRLGLQHLQGWKTPESVSEFDRKSFSSVERPYTLLPTETRAEDESFTTRQRSGALG